jgi:hypothetical protein
VEIESISCQLLTRCSNTTGAPEVNVDFDLSKVLPKLKGKLLAVTVIITGDLYFFVKMLDLRKNFLFLEFWMVVSFVEIIVLMVCQQILRIYMFRVGASESYKLFQLQDKRLSKLSEQVEELQSKAKATKVGGDKKP